MWSYCSGKHSIRKLPKINLLVTKLEMCKLSVCSYSKLHSTTRTIISKFGLTFTLNDCKPPVPVVSSTQTLSFLANN